MGEIYLATRSEHKVREFARLLPEVGVQIAPLGIEMPPEDGDSYAENALIKARTVFEATGQAALADDSGIEAQALDGAPGIRSARFAGENASDEDNLAKLESNVPQGTWLRYVCALAFVDADGKEHVFTGVCEGAMASARSGSLGFGYDPVFIPKGEFRTMADHSDDEKDAISHRGVAARSFLAWWRHQYGATTSRS